MSQKKIAFVTGANGFVGSHLVELLIEKGLDVHCLMRASSDDRWIKKLEITIHREGIENVIALKTIFNQYHPSYIFHLAGTVTARTYEDFERGNVKPTKAILEAALGFSTIEKIIVTSSLAASCPTRLGHPVNEECERNPLTDYGKSKVVEENLAHQYMERLPISIVRPPVVYGEREREVLLFFKTISNHLMPLIGFGPKSLSLVYVKDLINGMYLCATSPISSGQTYFLGGYREEYTWQEIGKLASSILKVSTISLRVPHFIVFMVAYIAEFIANLSGKISPLNRQKAREMVCESWSCSSQKANRDFGYKPKTDIDEGFRKTIAWYQSMKWI